MTKPARLEKPVAEMSEDEFDEWIGSLPPAPGILHVDDDDPAEDALVEADIAAGRVYPHALVGEWLKTAGEPDWKPFEEWLAARDGRSRLAEAGLVAGRRNCRLHQSG